MSSKLLLNRYFWDKLPSDYLDEIRSFYKSFNDEILNNASVPNSISTLSDEFYFATIDFFLVDNYKKSLQFSEEFSICPVDENVKTLAKHIPTIDDVYDDEKEWFKLVTKTNDSLFIFFMVDRRLENNIFNQKLWKRFIHFLVVNKEFKMLLGVYSIYCRIFPTDYAMIQSYKKLTQKYGKIYVSWKKPFDFEIPRDKTPKKAVNISLLSMVKYVPSSNNYKYPEPPKIEGKLAFPNPIIYYIRKKASSKILQKLHQTCKYFFKLQPTPFCHRFIFSDKFDETKFDANSMGTSLAAKTPLRKIVVQNTLHVCEQSDKLALSKFLPNFYRFEIKFLRIHNQELTKSEFEFIAENGNIELLEFSDVFIYEDGNDVEKGSNSGNAIENVEAKKKLVVLEEIIKLCPKIREFFSSHTAFSPNTTQFLQNFNFQNTIKSFHIYRVNNFFDIDSFINFFRKISSDAKMSLSFSPDLDDQQLATFMEELKQKLKCTSTVITQLPVGNI